MSDDNAVFRVEYLPIDLSLGKGDCKYQIYKYIIMRETNHFVWAIRVYDDSPRTHTPVKYARREFYKFGAFCERDEAVDQIYVLLSNDLQAKYSSYLRSKKELEVFHKEYGVTPEYLKEEK